MNKRAWALLLIILLLAAGIAVHSFRHGDAAAEHSPALSVTVVIPEKKTVRQQMSVTGVTVAREEIVVVTELSGLRIQKVFTDVGDVVKKGQIVALLDAESLNHQLAQAQSDYAAAHDAYTRVDAIKNTGAVSRESVINKRSAMQSAKARVDNAQLDLQRATITAPESGIVFERNVSIGMLVNASQPLYRIARNREIEVEANIPEDAFSKLKIGQATKVSLSGDPTEMNGKIRLISPQVDNVTRTAKIRIALMTKSTMPLGLFASAAIDTGEVGGVALPATALQHDTAGDYVWGLNAENTAVRMPVTVLLRSGNTILINVIPSDTKIIARAGAFVREGDPVTIVEDH